MCVCAFVCVRERDYNSHLLLTTIHVWCVRFVFPMAHYSQLPKSHSKWMNTFFGSPSATDSPEPFASTQQQQQQKLSLSVRSLKLVLFFWWFFLSHFIRTKPEKNSCWYEFHFIISTTCIATHNTGRKLSNQKNATKCANFTSKKDDSNEKAQQIGHDQKACDKTQNSNTWTSLGDARVWLCAIQRRMHKL